MATSKCNITFEIDYTSSTPIKGATASYRISGSKNPYTVHVIDPVPVSGSVVTLPPIETPGNYDLIVTLKTNEGLSVNKESFFKIGNCIDSRTRTIFWNHATFTNGKEGTVLNFLAEKNGVLMVDNTESNTGYNYPIEKWKSFTAQVGDKIKFSTNLLKSGSNGKTAGGMSTYSTTGKTGTVDGMYPTAPNTIPMDFQQIGPTSGTKRTFTFTVESGLNYALKTGYDQ